MIQKLRKKVVLVLMAVVCLFLVGILVSLFVTSKTEFERRSVSSFHEPPARTEGDKAPKNPDMIFYRVMKSVSPGSIVLFHDIHPGAALMLPTMIRAFKAQGYRFITISELIRITTSAS